MYKCKMYAYIYIYIFFYKKKLDQVTFLASQIYAKTSIHSRNLKGFFKLLLMFNLHVQAIAYDFFTLVGINTLTPLHCGKKLSSTMR